MRKYYLLLTGVFIGFVFMACNQKQQKIYDSMPEELAKIYRAIDKNPKDASLYIQLSDYYLNIRQLDSALNNALIAVKLDSTNSDVYVSLSDIYFSMGNVDATEDVLNKAITLDKKNNSAYLKLGELYYIQKDFKSSKEILTQAIKQETHNPKAYFIMGWNYLGEGDTALAIRNMTHATDQDPDYFDAYMELGLLYHGRLNPLAINYYNNALNVQPNSIQVLYNMAMFYQETEDYEKALEKYRMILQIDSKHRNALHNMGWVYMIGQEKYEEGMTFFTKAIEVDSSYVEAIYNRGYCFENLKQYENARQDYMYSLKLETNFPLAIEGLNRLDKLQK